jgi:acyl-coenzyme A thioesterase PaaI-like protein
VSTHFLRRIADKLPHNYLCIAINFWPPFIGTGIKVKTISDDFRLVETYVKLHWYNKNLVGTHFGGTIFAMTDAFYMMMLMENLGKNYIVWDKKASIEFKKPGRGTLFATFQFTEAEIEDIRKMADTQEKYIFDKTVDVHDAEGNVIATVVKTIYVKRKVL